MSKIKKLALPGYCVGLGEDSDQKTLAGSV